MRRHTSKIIALSLAFIMTLMTLVPYQAGLGFAFAGTETAGQSAEEVSGEPVENVDIEDQATPAVSGDTEAAGDAEDPADAEPQVGTDSEDEEADKDTASPIGFEGKEFDVTIESSPEAGLPDDTKLDVKEITAKDKEYKEYYKKVLETAQADAKRGSTRAVRFVRLYDMTLTSGDEVLEPDVNVDVTIDYSKAVDAGKAESAEDPEGVKILHFGEDKKGELKADVLESKVTEAKINDTALTEAKFEAESFSVYAVVYTVDFHYGDGEYDFSIPGESNIMLSEVMERLHMEPLTINDVKAAKFSDSELVKVQKVKGAVDAENGTAPADDWKLTSLKPFSTDELLTLTLNDGSKVEVKVTDAPASSSEFVPVTNQMLVDAKGTTSVPVVYQFANGQSVTGDEIGLPVSIPSGAVYNGNVLLGLLNTSTFERNINNAATWNNTVAVQNTSTPWVVDGASKTETQVRLVLKASNGKTYYTKNYYNIGRITDGNTTTVANEINNNKYMFVDDDYFVVKLVLSRNGSYSNEGIEYPTVKNSDMTATATELDADTYGSNMLPSTVSIAGVPYTVVDNITTFKENNVTYSLDRANLRATVTSGTTTAGTVDVNGTVFIIPRQNEYSGSITYNGVTYTVDTSRTDGAPQADASAYKAATIGAGTNRTITYRNDYGQDTTDPTVVNDITVSIPLSKTIKSSITKEDLLSDLGDKSLEFGVEQGSSNPAGGATVALADGGSGTDYDLTYADLLNNGTNTGSDTDTVYTLDGNDSPWKVTFTKEGTYTFTVLEKETGHQGVANQSEAVTLTYYIVEEEGSLRLAEVYKAKNAEIESTKVSEADLENLDLSKLFNTSFALGSAVSKPPEITASGETITMNLHSDTSGVITTKFTFDFSRSFEIEGQLGTPDSDAVAIAFHGYDALPAYRWDCNNGFDDFHYGNGNARHELRFLRYGYIPPNGDLKKGFLYNILTRDLDHLRGWYAYKVENNVRLPYVASSGLNGDVRNTDGGYDIVPNAKSYESFDNHDEN